MLGSFWKNIPRKESIIQLGSFCSCSSCISRMHAGNGLVQLQTCRLVSILPLRGPLIIRFPLILESREAFLSFPISSPHGSFTQWTWCQKICHCSFGSLSKCSHCHSLYFWNTLYFFFYPNMWPWATKPSYATWIDFCQ